MLKFFAATQYGRILPRRLPPVRAMRGGSFFFEKNPRATSRSNSRGAGRKEVPMGLIAKVALER